jgi:hypothetical protein
LEAPRSTRTTDAAANKRETIIIDFPFTSVFGFGGANHTQESDAIEHDFSPFRSGCPKLSTLPANHGKIQPALEL